MDRLLEGAQIAAFLPTKDLAKSVEFYEALGFEKRAHSADFAIFDADSGRIVLTTVNDDKWDGAFMMALMVDDLGAWWERIEDADLPVRFGVDAPRPPAMQPWGLEVAYVVDPAGVLWHFQQRPVG